MKRYCLGIMVALLAGIGCSHGSSSSAPPSGFQPLAAQAAFSSAHPGATIISETQNGSAYSFFYRNPTGVTGRATYSSTGQLLQGN